MSVLGCFRIFTASVLIVLALTIGYFTFERQHYLVTKTGYFLRNREQIIETIQTTKNPNYRAPRHEREERYDLIYEHVYSEPMREVILCWFLTFGLAGFGVFLFFTDRHGAKRLLLKLGYREPSIIHGVGGRADLT